MGWGVGVGLGSGEGLSGSVGRHYRDMVECGGQGCLGRVWGSIGRDRVGNMLRLWVTVHRVGLCGRGCEWIGLGRR